MKLLIPLFMLSGCICPEHTTICNHDIGFLTLFFGGPIIYLRYYKDKYFPIIKAYTNKIKESFK